METSKSITVKTPIVSDHKSEPDHKYRPRIYYMESKKAYLIDEHLTYPDELKIPESLPDEIEIPERLTFAKRVMDIEIIINVSGINGPSPLRIMYRTVNKSYQSIDYATYFHHPFEDIVSYDTSPTPIGTSIDDKKLVNEIREMSVFVIQNYLLSGNYYYMETGICSNFILDFDENENQFTLPYRDTDADGNEIKGPKTYCDLVPECLNPLFFKILKGIRLGYVDTLFYRAISAVTESLINNKSLIDDHGGLSSKGIHIIESLAKVLRSDKCDLASNSLPIVTNSNSGTEENLDK